MKAAAVKASRRPIADEGTSFVSASIATQVHTSPTPNVPFIDSGTFFAFAYTNAQISSHWMRFALSPRTVLSWYSSQAAPTSRSEERRVGKEWNSLMVSQSQEDRVS